MGASHLSHDQGVCGGCWVISVGDQTADGMEEMNICHRPGCDPKLEPQPLLVRCSNCGLAGGVGRTCEEAIKVWNSILDEMNDAYFLAGCIANDPTDQRLLSVPAQRLRNLAAKFLELADKQEKGN